MLTVKMCDKNHNVHVIGYVEEYEYTQEQVPWQEGEERVVRIFDGSDWTNYTALPNQTFVMNQNGKTIDRF